MGEITISVEEYKGLLYKSVCVEAFKEFVKQERYNISREDCARYLGFGLMGEDEA